MEHGGPAPDGEHLRQRAFRLRPPRHLRAADQPKPERYEIIERPDGFRAETTTITINNPPAAHRVSGSTEPTTRRHMRKAWSGDRAPWMANVVMPVAWKRRHGEGRGFYSSLKPVSKEFELLEMRTILRRRMLRAAR
jgi:hypothetical protein